uniref:Aminotran_1_2 domain-containing protein n=1 Tax=Heterorhabditis bacteriophora TaxID=37862 RepID=A0A1I7XT01_HETBA
MDLLVQIFGYFNTGAGTKIEAQEEVRSKEEVLNKRKDIIGSKCQIFYKDDPFMVSRAFMQYLYDESGKEYLDCISNVQHVGHCHPIVVDAISKQLATSTCNVRFVSQKLTDCAEEILKTLPGLDTVLFCNSGQEFNLKRYLKRRYSYQISEANDLALRLARDYTGHTDAIVIDHAYHGHVTTTMQMSPYKFDHGSTLHQPEWVHVVSFFKQSIYSSILRGSAAVMWRSGHTSQRILFSCCQYGGNPVACAAVLSVMKVIHEENLLSHSHNIGREFERKLKELQDKHNCIGDVRGVGLFWGIDLVKDRKTRVPNDKLALSLILKLRREFGILLNADGPHSNIIKIKPPLCFTRLNLMQTVQAIDQALVEMGH